MHQRHDFGYMENADLQLLELPYTHRELSMVVLLPKRTDGLTDLEKNLTADNLRAWQKDARFESVDVTLPKFTFRAGMELADTLHAMGMTDAFDPEKADFSGMTTAERFFISKVIHQAFVAVDEEGTEAAAATAVVMRAGSAMRMPAPPKIFKADHPFLFMIRHNSTGEILFLGRLAEPKSE
jgi:serpin B